MEVIRKWWVRLLISIIVIGVISEIHHIITGNELPINGFILALALYTVLSVVYGFHARKQSK
tara:strand:+ start:283 stop:468 length:186 start_codon:yes stop_codon:yes gene_type:complete